MMKCRASFSWLLATGLALAACAKSNQPRVGGETNWLKVCTDQDGCGEGSCVCGVCTTECDSASRCSGAFAGSCVDTTSPLGASACADAKQVPTGLCLPGCGSDAECGAGFACRDAVCVTAAIAERFDVEQEPPGQQEAGLCRTADRCEEAEMCTWDTARAQAFGCTPLAGATTARCGSYDSIVSLGTDSAITYYYGEDGALVGTNRTGLANEPAACPTTHRSRCLRRARRPIHLRPARSVPAMRARLTPA